ncbi:FAD-dependent oxidoreductase [Klugiella xanthotipulae]|uniref:NAD/ferredoxin-dependent reductase-like protein n=1 Tax=Klugiella xanthotipulae TaxID=244735 RepID=A0A543I461_9MICO|nr:FAD-dependent oxidoreductase [Klugiella xanthotipulae]TQM65379.1 NAD/ferredoxin-dependent reductase-like protein [Klugiella xanthotipulae]
MTTNDSPQSVVIVGGGVAGISAARELRRLGYDGDLTIVDAGAAPYDRPPLSKDYLLGTKTMPDIHLAPAKWFADQNVTLVTTTRVERIEPDAGQVLLSDASVLHADAIILATGGTPRPLPVPGGDLPAVHVLRSAEDADRLRAALTPGTRLLVIGAGLIGAETASTALHLGASVTLVDPMSVPLLPAVGPEVAAFLHAQHPERGITTIHGSVTGIAQESQTSPLVATLATGDTIEADLVLAGIGITADTALAEAAGLDIDNGVIVDYSQRTSHPRVFAAGDSSRRRGPDGVLSRRAEHWDAAEGTGRAAAAGVLGREPVTEISSWFWTDRHGIHVEGVGDMSPSGTTVLRGTLGDGPATVFRLDGDRVVGAVSIDDSNAIRAARRMIDGRISVTAEDLSNPEHNLRSLLRSTASKG